MAGLKSIKAIQQAGTAAVKQLRKQKFARGIPFMINSKQLPQDESYLEYPDGRMVVVKLSSSANGFVVVKEISKETATSIRLQYHLG